MKTYILDTIERFKRYSQKLDVKTILCSKAWYVLNEDGMLGEEDATIRIFRIVQTEGCTILHLCLKV